MASRIIDLIFRTKGAETASKKTKNLDSKLGNLGQTAMKVGAAFFAAKGVLKGLGTFIELAGAQELAEKKLETALGRSSQALLDHASALQKQTTFGDEATIEAMALMAAFTDNEEELKVLTMATMDYAAATGTDLNSAAQLVGRSFGTSMNAMSRYGVEVDGAAGSSERLHSLTGNLSKMFGGQAKAAAQTMSGQIEQMNNDMGDLGEQIGDLLEPAVLSLTKTLTTAATEATSFFASLGAIFTVAEETNEMAIINNDKWTETLHKLAEAKKRAREEGTTIPEAHAKNEADAEAIKLAEMQAEIEKDRAEQIKKGIGLYKLRQDEEIKAIEHVSDKTKELKDVESDRYATSIRGVERNIKAALTQAIASAVAAEAGKGLLGLATGTAAAIGISALFDRFVSPTLAGFTGQTPTVNQSINIQGGLISDSYVRNTLSPALNKVRALG